MLQKPKPCRSAHECGLQCRFFGCTCAEMFRMVPFFDRYLRCASVRGGLVSGSDRNTCHTIGLCGAAECGQRLTVECNRCRSAGVKRCAVLFAPARAATTSPVSDTVRTVESADRSSVSESSPETAVSLSCRRKPLRCRSLPQPLREPLVPSGAVMEDEPLSVGAGATVPPPVPLPPPPPPPPLLGLTAKVAVTATSFAGMVKV